MLLCQIPFSARILQREVREGHKTHFRIHKVQSGAMIAASRLRFIFAMRIISP